MSRNALIHLPPSDLDAAAADACARLATPSLERTLRVLTWLADEKLLLVGSALSWAYVRSATSDPALHRAADRMICSVAAAGVVPHLCKHLFARERPNRTRTDLRRRGIAKSGNAWDSFPSGHAVHVGALAPWATRMAPPAVRPWVWPIAAALAGTRLVLLAHYLSDVLAGLVIGVVIDKVMGRLFASAKD